MKMMCMHCLEEGQWTDEDCCPSCRAKGHTSPWEVSRCPACNKEYFDKMAELIGRVERRHQMQHHVSSSCGGEICSICGDPATHKVGEEIMHDDPMPDRHNLTAYVCCDCFRMILGPAVPCGKEAKK